MFATDINLIQKTMILTSPSKAAHIISILFSISFLLVPSFLFAQGSVTLSVSPTLFEMTANPSQEWSSSVRIINANSFPITVYSDVVNFKPTGEGGQGVMVPVLEDETQGATLAEWIAVEGGEFEIPAEQTVSIPFSITVPDDAAPGGHFAAILIGTKAFEENEGAALVETSQVVTSLVFLSVAGDVLESGQIREFTTSKTITESPDIDFSVRFENTGNVHLQPQGNITITNMWGKERGVVPINMNSQFGNVLPESVRKYNFSWSGDWSFADIGRYKAVVALAYGSESRQFTDAVTTFWVLPWRALLLVLFIIVGLVWCVVQAVKLYIRRMLQLAGVTPELQKEHRNKTARTNVSITAPIEAGILDLRSDLKNTEGSMYGRAGILLKKYKVFVVLALAILVFASLFIWYLILALTSERGYQISYEENGEVISVETEAGEDDDKRPIVVNTLPKLQLVNRSGSPATLKQVESRLVASGYDVSVARSLQSVTEDRTVIVYDPIFAEDILSLQSLLGEALVSSYITQEGSDPEIIIYVGTDQIQN